MLHDKKLFLEKIHTIVSKKWKEKTSTVYSQTLNGQALNDIKTAHTNNNNNMQLISQLQKSLEEKFEGRITKLEVQNIQLAGFFDFLIEYLPDLVNNFLRRKDDCDKKNFSSFSFFESKDFPTNEKRLKLDRYPTRRELEVLECLIKGLCAKEIASKLCISETTVVTHKKNLKDKFKSKNTAELISKAQYYLSKRLEADI